MNSPITQNANVQEAIKELCQQILVLPEYKTSLNHVENFLADDQARGMFQQVNEQREALHRKQQEGQELTEEEIAKYRESVDKMEENELVNNFLEGQNLLQDAQKEIVQYITKAIEMGRVPTAEELAAKQGGCCGGGCGC